ncbi:peptidoglycan DD-metalloendopeptidase family protein [Patescibacteria group bacterium]|nr:peptidoglycan DD-metalloendopeptidase family protein [Patescibacteria group bacterium]
MPDDNSQSNNTLWQLGAILALLLFSIALPMAYVYVPSLGAIFDYIPIPNDKRLSQVSKSTSYTSSFDFELNFPSIAINIPTVEIGNCLDEYISSKIGERGLYGQGETITTYSQDNDLNPAFVIAIAEAESGLGVNITSGNYNYWNLLPPYNFSDWEDSIETHTGTLKNYFERGQNTIVTIGNGAGGNYIPLDASKYAANNCNQAKVGTYAYCPCGTTTDGREYGTDNDDSHDPHKVNQYWIGNVTRFFDEVSTQCNYLAPPRPTGGQWCLPTTTTTITATFKDPEYKRILGYDHFGVDFAPTPGIDDEYEVFATSGGLVIDTNNTCPRGSRNDSCGQYFGNFVKIDHQNGYISIYAHLQKDTLLVQPGQNVVKKQKLADIDSSGNSDGDHLHFEVRYNAEAIDPQNLPLSSCSIYQCQDQADQVKEFLIAQIGKDFSPDNNIGDINATSFDAAGLFGSAWYYATNNSRYYHSYIPSFENNGDINIYHPSSNILSEILPGDAVFGGTYHGEASANTDYQHMGVYIGPTTHNGQFYQNAVVEASGHQSRVIIREFSEGPWDKKIYARPIACN